jgi:hypothetical protein
MRAVDTTVSGSSSHARRDTRQTTPAESFIEKGRVDIRAGARRSDLLSHQQLTVQDRESVAAAPALFRIMPSLGFSDCPMLEMARKAGQPGEDRRGAETLAVHHDGWIFVRQMQALWNRLFASRSRSCLKGCFRRLPMSCRVWRRRAARAQKRWTLPVTLRESSSRRAENVTTHLLCRPPMNAGTTDRCRSLNGPVCPDSDTVRLFGGSRCADSCSTGRPRNGRF